jgi:hypothetical protein
MEELGDANGQCFAPEACSVDVFSQLKHFHTSVGWSFGQVTQSCRPQPGQEMRTRSVPEAGGVLLAMGSPQEVENDARV